MSGRAVQQGFHESLGTGDRETVAVRPESHVYVVGYAPHPEALFIKIGKSNNPKHRLKAYKTHLPGGPSFMVASAIWTEQSAFRHEAKLLAYANGNAEFQAMGGEWFSTTIAGCEALIAELQEVGDYSFQVEISETRVATGKRKPTWVSRRQDDIQNWRAAGERSPSGVASGYSGPLRG
jgi:hypothetical protein